MYRRERKGSISSVATSKNQVSLFQNLSDVITEIENMKLNNELLPGFKKYVDYIYPNGAFYVFIDLSQVAKKYKYNKSFSIEFCDEFLSKYNVAICGKYYR